MLATLIGLTYLGVMGCYVASPSTGPPPLERVDASPHWWRLGGLLLLLLGLGAAGAIFPVGEALLVWLSAAMAACSALVIASPLLDRFVTVTAPLALGLVVLGLIF